MSVIKNRVLRNLLFIFGAISLVLGVVGIFLPLLPTTPFILLAAWCFLRSSSKAHQWIYRQPLLGKTLRNWEENRSIRRPTKILAVSMILISGVFIWFKVPVMYVKIPVLALLIIVVLFIMTRREGGPPQ